MKTFSIYPIHATASIPATRSRFFRVACRTLISLLLLTTMAAQSADAQIWYLGLKAGPTFSNYKTKTPWKEATNIGYTFGGIAYKQISANFGLGAELQYIQKGYFHKVCNTITDRLRAQYLEIPIMADYAFIIPGMRNFKLHANAGIYAAYWLSGKYQTEGYLRGSESESFDFDDNDAKRFDFGPNIGGRIEYILKNASLSLDLRYELGLIDLQNRINDNTTNNNRAFIIGISYMKPLGM
ncbi:porin family protein [Chryseolinea sp. T2]|uniref:porin family protein n=1 Tax=Chryseolinea sp. T2 TaxID=3129255 RepID=UPI0030769AD0